MSTLAEVDQLDEYYYGKRPLTREELYAIGYRHGRKQLDPDTTLASKVGKVLSKIYDRGYRHGLYGLSPELTPNFAESTQMVTVESILRRLDAIANLADK